VASFGLTEWKAVEKKIPFAKASFPYRGAGKSVAIEKSEGFVKIIYDPKTKEILGAHIVGADATELIHEILLARTAELLPQDIATMIHAHPTLSEAVMEAMRSVEGWAIHA
jgi:dihydrolipoamide dehydrogenase